MQDNGHLQITKPSIYIPSRNRNGLSVTDRHSPDLHSQLPETHEANSLVSACRTYGNHGWLAKNLSLLRFVQARMWASIDVLRTLPLFFSRHFLRPRHAAISGALFMSLCACTALPDNRQDGPRLLEQIERSIMRAVDQRPGKKDPERQSGGNPSRDVVSERPEIARFDRPFRLVGTALTGDQIMRRLAENTNIEWIAEDSGLFGAEISLDVEIVTSGDLYSLVNMLAEVAGLRVSWDGARAVFTPDTTGIAGGAETDGYIITASVRSPELQSVILERFDVSCIQYAVYSICLGDHSDLASAFDVIKSASRVSSDVEWSLVATSTDLEPVISTIGLSDLITAQIVRSGLWLVASTDRAYIDLMLEVVAATDETECSHSVYRPKHRTPQEIISFLNAVQPFQCAQSVSVAQDAIIHYTEGMNKPKLVAMLAGFDSPIPQAKLAVYVVSESYLTSLGSSLEFDGQIPLTAVDGISSMSFQRLLVNASKNSSRGVRYVQLTTSGNTTVSVQSTDRVEGSVIVTDGGSQVAGVEERTVGLSVSSVGVVTPDAFVGNLSLVDSSLSEDTVLSSVCEGDVTLRMHQIVTVCAYERATTNKSARLIGLSNDRSSELVYVFVSLADHTVASISQAGALLP